MHTDWLHGFLADPSNEIRPWLDLRMPTFQFTEEQLNTLTRYFAALDGVPYPVRAAAASPIPRLVAHGPRPVHPVAVRQVPRGGGQAARTRSRPTWPPTWPRCRERLRARLADAVAGRTRQHIQPGTRMPSNFPEDPEENAFPEILGGDQAKQIEAVRAYLLTFGRGGQPATAPAAGAGGR